MKIPIEFINSDSKEFAQDILNMTVDLAAAKHRHFNISLQKIFGRKHNKNSSRGNSCGFSACGISPKRA